MVDRPPPPSKRDSPDEDQPDFEVEAPGVTLQPELPPVMPSVDEVWQQTELDENRVDHRYSLRELFFVTTIVAGAMAVRRLLRPDWTAALLGVCVMLGMLYLAIDPAPPRSARLAWFTLLLLYILFSALAAFA